jgi:hypothetical protein
MKGKKKFSWRAFVTFGLFYSFLLMTISGVILYIAPPGRIAHWSEWTLWGLTKEGWQSMHTNFSLLFMILGIFHLFSINWKAFLGHIRSRISRNLNRKWEMVLSTVFSVWIFVGVIYNIPPFKTIMDWGEQFTESWEEKDNTPPVPHAELYSLTDFSKEFLRMVPDSAVLVLVNHGIRVDSIEQTIKDIATLNDLAPSEIFAFFGKTGDEVEQKREESVIIQGGNGIGHKTLQQIADEYAIPVDDLVNALKKEGFEATPEDVMKDIADEYGVSPADILDILNNRNGK